MKDNSISFASCLIVDTISFDKLLMCKLERTNDIKWTLAVHQKRLKKIKFEDVYLIHITFLAEVIYILLRI